MIDLHNHILPAVDDGAADLAESVEIGRQFVTEGVTRIAATPHLDAERRNGANAPVMRERLALVRGALAAAAVPLEVLPGNELYLTPDAVRLLTSGEASTLGESRYVLVELSVTIGERPLFLDDTVFQLQLAGYSVILAHPERYAFVHRDLSALDGLRDRGVVLQLTAPGLLGGYGNDVRRVAERLLLRGVCDLGSSDRHRPNQKRSLQVMHERLTAVAGSETADLLLRENPARILDNRPVHPAEPVAASGGSVLSRLFRRG